MVNERDELGPNLVPDYMTSVQDGALLWLAVELLRQPCRRAGASTASGHGGDGPSRRTTHCQVMSQRSGLTFSMDSALPEPYANGAFIGEHGSWNRNAFNGYKVVYVPFDAMAVPTGKAQDVVTGFLDGDQTRGRPVGVAIDGTGALLIADDAGNTVWRVAAADGSVTPQPIDSDRVVSSAAGAQPANEAEAPAGRPVVIPSQTDTAPAVSPEDPQ